MATFTVPSTGIFRAANGDARQFFQNDVIDLNTAIYFQMAGAALPAVVDNSPPGLRAAIDALTIDPLTTVDIRDDFITGGNTSGLVGSLNWAFVAGNITMLTGEAGHPGIITRDTSATISTTAYMVIRSTIGNPPFVASAFFDLTWVFRLNMNDVDTRVRLGLSNAFSVDAPVDGIYIEKILTDTQWFGVCRTGSVQSRTPVLATVDTGWHKIRIRRVDANTIGFTFDGGAEVTLATNVPTVALSPGNHIFNNSAVLKSLDLDFFRLRITGLTR